MHPALKGIKFSYCRFKARWDWIVSRNFVTMIEKAYEVQELWMEMPSLYRYGTLVYWNNCMGMVIPCPDAELKQSRSHGERAEGDVIADHPLLKDGEALIVIETSIKDVKLENPERGIPVLSQKQLQEMLDEDYFYHGFCVDEVNDVLRKLYSDDGVYSPFESPEEFWLAFVMLVKYDKIWDVKKKEWIRIKEE